MLPPIVDLYNMQIEDEAQFELDNKNIKMADLVGSMGTYGLSSMVLRYYLHCILQNVLIEK